MVHFWPVVQNMVAQELAGPLSPVGPGLPLDAHQPDHDDGHADDGLLPGLRHRPDWKEYAIYLFAGQVPWTMFGGSLNDCSTCILANEGLIRKIYLPKLVFPVAKVLLNLTTFVLSFTALVRVDGILLGAKAHPGDGDAARGDRRCSRTFALGLGLVLAVTNTFYRDTGHVITVVLQAWYFATPIIWGDERPAEGLAGGQVLAEPGVPVHQDVPAHHP